MPVKLKTIWLCGTAVTEECEAYYESRLWSQIDFSPNRGFQ